MRPLQKSALATRLMMMLTWTAHTGQASFRAKPSGANRFPQSIYSVSQKCRVDCVASPVDFGVEEWFEVCEQCRLVPEFREGPQLALQVKRVTGALAGHRSSRYMMVISFSARRPGGSNRSMGRFVLGLRER